MDGFCQSIAVTGYLKRLKHFSMILLMKGVIKSYESSNRNENNNYHITLRIGKKVYFTKFIEMLPYICKVWPDIVVFSEILIDGKEYNIKKSISKKTRNVKPV